VLGPRSEKYLTTDELLHKIDDLLDHFQHLLGLLETIASHVRPPLPLPIMAARVIVALYGCIPARLSAAGGHIVHWAKNAPAPAPAHRGLFVSGVIRCVALVEFVLSPFKLENAESFRIRAEIAENRRDTAESARNLAETLRSAAEDRSMNLCFQGCALCGLGGINHFAV
jgi:hypothetical protein